jgi:hypothetical protein
MSAGRDEIAILARDWGFAVLSPDRREFVTIGW